MNWKVVVLISIGCVLIVLGITLPLVFPLILESKLTEKLVITPNGPILKTFSKTPIPIYYQVYFFNITNSEDVLYGDTAILQQIGPYTYRQERVKYNMRWNHTRGTVFYQEKKTYFFEREKSVGSDDDMITTVNPVYMSLIARGDSMGYFAQLAFSLAIRKFDDYLEPFMTHSVKELTFDGYEDGIIKGLYDMSGKEKYASGKTGYLYGKNTSLDDGIEIFSGELGMENYQHIDKWHNLTQLTFWGTNTSNMLNGTTGSQFARPVRIEEPLFMYTSDLCRSIYLNYEKDIQHGPLTLHRFSIRREVLAASPENSGFCKNEFICRDSMLDISECREGAPIVMSTPHFYLGSKKDLEMVEGLNPSKEEHETYLDIEPNTGVTMRAAKRMQVNIVFKPSSTLPDLDDVKPVIFPILWVNESAVVPLERAEALDESLNGSKQKAYYLAGALIVIGVVLLVIACILRQRMRKNEKKLPTRRQDANDKTGKDVNVSFVGGKVVS